MFRRAEDGLPPDAFYPANLKALGFFVNGTGHVRKIKYPDKNFDYRFSNNDRHNDVRREAFQTCLREEVDKRLRALGLTKLYLANPTKPTPGLPLPANPPPRPSIPILAPPTEILRTKKKVYVVINDSNQDLGILAYRQLQRDLGINGGSVINYAKEIYARSSESKDSINIYDDLAEIKNKDRDTPALIVLNPGQLLYSHKQDRALSLQSWNAQPRKSICHDNIRIDDNLNYVPGMKTAKEHIDFAWRTVFYNTESKYIHEEAQVYIVAIEDGAANYLELVDKNPVWFAARVAALALISPNKVAAQFKSRKARKFLSEKARAWSHTELSSNPQDCIGIPGARIPGTNTVPICTTFAASDQPSAECIFTDFNVQHEILNFFDEVASSEDPFRWCNPDFDISPSILQPAKKEEKTNNPGFEDEVSSEQQAIDELCSEIKHMKASHVATPFYPIDPELNAGSYNLAKRIAIAESELKGLETKLLAKGGLKAGQGEEVRGKWETKGGGPKVPFAGTMVDSEALKAAGLLETAEEGLAEVDSGNGGDVGRGPEAKSEPEIKQEPEIKRDPEVKTGPEIKTEPETNKEPEIKREPEE
ncbi:Arb2 domain-containing protein [Lophiotrema nucula]|uniref:Arb2 domain-containing protein n=1 Tax=Lophiotrema nucula TaxID=690887 RepID=A0A6A5YSN5_9PLEO|nr:Arb2 domain-containing protein [Lophiotrema nucula]